MNELQIWTRYPSKTDVVWTNCDWIHTTPLQGWIYCSSSWQSGWHKSRCSISFTGFSGTWFCWLSPWPSVSCALIIISSWWTTPSNALSHKIKASQRYALEHNIVNFVFVRIFLKLLVDFNRFCELHYALEMFLISPWMLFPIITLSPSIVYMIRNI